MAVVWHQIREPGQVELVLRVAHAPHNPRAGELPATRTSRPEQLTRDREPGAAQQHRTKLRVALIKSRRALDAR